MVTIIYFLVGFFFFLLNITFFIWNYVIKFDNNQSKYRILYNHDYYRFDYIDIIWEENVAILRKKNGDRVTLDLTKSSLTIEKYKYAKQNKI